jgi:DNA-binding transcriptional regulator YiaG
MSEAHPPEIPTPEQILAVREDAGLTQTEAARLIYRSLRNWQYLESGKRRMDPALWELLIIKTSSFNNKSK